MAKRANTDLKDSAKDEEKLQQDKATLDLPDVKDIPGQENIRVPDLREMADTTISSDDEEGIGIWDNNEPAEDLSGDRFGAASVINTDSLDTDEDDAEAKLDETETEDESDEIDITDDSVSEDSDVTEDEKIALDRTENMDTPDNENLYRSELDNEDFDGEKLNEDTGISGKDLDVPGEEDDDANEEIGEEDEENNEYSLGDNE